MTIARKLIYAASNGDRQFVCNGKDLEDLFVLHEPNGPSGGRPSCVELSTFLSSGADCPERLALLGVIGSLVAASSTTVPACDLDAGIVTVGSPESVTGRGERGAGEGRS